MQIPAADLTPCFIPTGTPATNEDLLLHDQAAIEDLIACNHQLTDARAKNGATLAPAARS